MLKYDISYLFLSHQDQKKLQGQLVTEQEAIFGSKQSPSKSVNKNSRPSTGGVAGKRFSLGGAMLQNMLVEKVGAHSLSKNNHAKQQGSRSHHHSGLMVHSSGKNIKKLFSLKCFTSDPFIVGRILSSNNYA